MQTKVCGRCKNDLTHSAFAPSQVPLRGAWCRSCTSVYHQERKARPAASKKARAVAECLHCGKDIRGRRVDAKHCSRACQAAAWHRANPESVSRSYYLKTYKLTDEDVQQMLDAQGGCCAICGTQEPRQWHLDHCHTSGRVRGVLCRACNHGLGNFRDTVKHLQAAISYLERAQG